MSKLKRLELKDNFIDNLEDLAARVRRLEARVVPPESLFKHPEDTAGQLYWFTVVLLRDDVFPIWVPYTMPEEEEV